MADLGAARRRAPRPAPRGARARGGRPRRTARRGRRPTGGPPRALIGPVTRVYERWGSGPRLDDETAAKLPASERQAPWATRYTAPAPPAPAFEAKLEHDDEHLYLAITAPRALGTLVVEVLDHHRLPIKRLTRRIGAGTTRFRFDPKLDGGIPIVRFQVGRWSGYSELHCMDGCRLSPPE